MRRFWIVNLIVLLCFALVFAPAQAQELTPEPSPADTVTVVEPDQTVINADSPVEIIRDQNPVLLIVLGVGAILFALMTGGFVFMARQLFNALPPWAAELLVANRGAIEAVVDAGFDRIDLETAKTSNPLDDMLAKFGREQVEQWISAFYEPSTPTVMANKNQTPDG